MSFDRLAPHYRWMEWALAGQKLQRTRVTWLEAVRDCRKVLLIGEGPGRFLEACLRALPQAEITCLDASAAMLQRARQTCEFHGAQRTPVKFIHAALPDWTPPPQHYDLIVTHFFLDCFPPAQLTQVIAKISAAAAPGARWLIAEFHEPRSGWQRWRARLILTLAYAFFRITTRLPARQLPGYEHALTDHGFRLEQRRLTEWGLLTSDLWRAGFANPDCRAEKISLPVT